MKSQKPKNLTRRQFVLESLMSGAILVVPSCKSPEINSKSSKTKLDYDTVLIKNPAFSRERLRGRLYLTAMSSQGQHLNYRIDEGASYLWDKVPTPDQHLQGERVTVQQLVTDAAEKYQRNRASQNISDDVLAFLQEAVEEYIFVTSESTMYLSYTPPKWN